ncbi:MAG: hypothetical protein VYA80_03250 [Pseudomonadota bacterium]|nr:hypothetical protein [Pseudomonadota bacterium]
MSSLYARLIALSLAFVLFGCHDNDDTETVAPLETGLYTITSDGYEREFFIQLPDESGAVPINLDDDPLPLLFMYHGYTGSSENWLSSDPEKVTYYDLAEVVGNQAILIAPNGLADSNGVRSWGASADFEFFVDLIAELDRRGLEYNPNKIFVAGHSNGAGHAQQLACRYGDIIRGVAAAAGSLTSTECVGSAAIMLMHGFNDPLTSGVLAGNSRSYWTLYNGWDPDAFIQSPLGQGSECIDYSFPGEDNSPYPFLYCEHDQGHDWPTFGSEIAWQLFSSLSEQNPTPNFPLGGGADRATPPSDTTLTFRIDAPANINRPLKAAATLRPLSFIDNPTCSAPDIILNYTFSVDGEIVAGEISEEIIIPITYFTFSGDVEFPSDWALSITVYVEGGNDSTIPSPGVDHDAIIPFSIIDRTTPQVIDEPLALQPVGDLCGILN